MWQIWALNSAVCSGGAIFHRAQTWHLKCRSSGIVEIVEIWKFWVRREIWLERHGYWVRRPLEGWKVEGCCWGEQHLTTSQFLVFHFNPLCPTYGGVALCPHVCPHVNYLGISVQIRLRAHCSTILHHKVSSFSGEKSLSEIPKFHMNQGKRLDICSMLM